MLPHHRLIGALLLSWQAVLAVGLAVATEALVLYVLFVVLGPVLLPDLYQIAYAFADADLPVRAYANVRALFGR